MSRDWVLNASPLIVLAKIKQLSLLSQLCTQIVVPRAVFAEVAAGREDDPARQWLAGDGARYVRDVGAANALSASWDLGPGEAEVLTWARAHHGFEVVIDDRAARMCALTLGIPLRGTLSVLILAKREGLLDAVAPLLVELARAGFRVEPNITSEALRLAGEPESTE